MTIRAARTKADETRTHGANDLDGLALTMAVSSTTIALVRSLLQFIITGFWEPDLF